MKAMRIRSQGDPRSYNIMGLFSYNCPHTICQLEDHIT